MTLLSLLFAGYKAIQKKLDEQHTYETMSHLDERLLQDVGLCRQGNRIVAWAAVEEAEAVSDIESVTVTAEYRGVGLLQDSGG